MVALRDLRRPAVAGLQTLAVAACYFAAGRLGLLRELSVGDAVFSPIWPPTGIALAALLVLGPRAWPGIALGSLLVILSLTSFTSFRPSALVTVATSTAGPVAAYVMLRAVGFRTDLARLRDGIALVLLGALAGMLISAGGGAGFLLGQDRITAADFGTVFLGWWVGDAMGVLIVTPLLLLLARARRPRTTRLPEALVLAATACVFVPLATRSTVSMLFLVFPLLIWAALRFLVLGSMLCALFTSVMAAVSATDDVGPFAGLSRIEVMIKLQAFNGSMALTALLLSAVITEQRNTRRSVERACQELVEVLDHLTAGEAPPPRPATREKGAGRWPETPV
ncbi:MASE1 domain-containing protein [Streptomyces sp. NPDC006610]|uniref:MASE1 domain-containing protein n=1 Tax=Streptomyces sp. NPDC006610 TaxID=3154584 RepID=UPI0033A29008